MTCLEAELSLSDSIPTRAISQLGHSFESSPKTESGSVLELGIGSPEELGEADRETLCAEEMLWLGLEDSIS